jgi:hypothetical protein
MQADGVDLSRALHKLYGTNTPPAQLVKLKGDASSRSYYRLTLSADAPATMRPRSLIVMRLPDDALASDERSGAERPTELPFVDVQRMLHLRGIPVPEIHVDDTAGRILLLQDLGDETFADRLMRTPNDAWPQLYAQAVDLLARMHQACAAGQPDESLAFRRHYDRTLIRWELDHFREWGLEAVCGSLSTADRSLLDQGFDLLADQVHALPQGFVHRDYQSRNLMWVGDDLLTVIDFQDALRGPAAYDLVALLCDSYVNLSPGLQDSMIARYGAAMKLGPEAAGRLRVDFFRIAVQRKLKDAGRFVYIDQVRGNPDFLQWYPQSLVYAGRALRELGLHDLTALLGRVLPGFPEHAPRPASIRT